MYFLYVSSSSETVHLLGRELQLVDSNMMLLTVPDGFELISFLQNIEKNDSYPDLIIFSLQTKRLDGKELLCLLKSDDIYCLIPVVMFLPQLECSDDSYCKGLGAVTIQIPQSGKDWSMAVQTMYSLCQ